eukprot:c14240_g1_i1 orf=2-277(-)
MHTEKCSMTYWTFTTLIKSYSRAGMPGRAIEVLNVMNKYSHNQCLPAYCTLIDVLLKGGFLAKAEHVYQIMLQNNCKPNKYTFSILLNGFGK